MFGSWLHLCQTELRKDGAVVVNEAHLDPFVVQHLIVGWFNIDEVGNDSSAFIKLHEDDDARFCVRFSGVLRNDPGEDDAVPC